jgi:hypothetical protein
VFGLPSLFRTKPTEEQLKAARNAAEKTARKAAEEAEYLEEFAAKRAERDKDPEAYEKKLLAETMEKIKKDEEQRAARHEEALRRVAAEREAAKVANAERLHELHAKYDGLDEEILVKLKSIFPIEIGKYGSIEWTDNTDRTSSVYNDRAGFFNFNQTEKYIDGPSLLAKVWGMDPAYESKLKTSNKSNEKNKKREPSYPKPENSYYPQPERFKDTGFTFKKTVYGIYNQSSITLKYEDENRKQDILTIFIKHTYHQF